MRHVKIDRDYLFSGMNFYLKKMDIHSELSELNVKKKIY